MPVTITAIILESHCCGKTCSLWYVPVFRSTLPHDVSMLDYKTRFFAEEAGAAVVAPRHDMQGHRVEMDTKTVRCADSLSKLEPGPFFPSIRLVFRIAFRPITRGHGRRTDAESRCPGSKGLARTRSLQVQHRQSERCRCDHARGRYRIGGPARKGGRSAVSCRIP